MSNELKPYAWNAPVPYLNLSAEVERLNTVKMEMHAAAMEAIARAEAAEAWSTRAPDPTLSAEVEPNTTDYILRYGGRCRECADNIGICPSSGLPCDEKQAKKAIAHVIAALNYGRAHGYLAPVDLSAEVERLTAERDEALKASKLVDLMMKERAEAAEARVRELEEELRFVAKAIARALLNREEGNA